MEENVSKYYYEQLNVSTNPVPLLIKFYCAVTGKTLEKPEEKVLAIQINKLITLFGRYTVFFALLELNNYDTDIPIFGLLFRICQRRFERENPTSPSPALQPLDGYLLDLEKERARLNKKKIVIPDSSSLEVGEVDE